jgi:hypothetical protein
MKRTAIGVFLLLSAGAVSRAQTGVPTDTQSQSTMNAAPPFSASVPISEGRSDSFRTLAFTPYPDFESDLTLTSSEPVVRALAASSPEPAPAQRGYKSLSVWTGSGFVPPSSMQVRSARKLHWPISKKIGSVLKAWFRLPLLPRFMPMSTLNCLPMELDLKSFGDVAPGTLGCTPSWAVRTNFLRQPREARTA